MRKEVIGNAVLYLGDCLEVLPTLAPVDALITDPPYGIAFEHGGFGKEPTKPITNFGQLGRRESKFSKVAGGGHKVRGDDRPFDPAPALSAAPIQALWGANHYANRLPIEAGCGWLFWDKVPIAGYEGRWSFADGELCWFSRKFALRTIRHYWNGGLRDGEERGKPREHPTQKPFAVMDKCIELARVPNGGTIIDPYMGSGTTGVAAARRGHPFIGIEIDERYFSVACERIENAQRQERLFA